ncbi:hypothetical protein DV736_g3708, partial [Chaetothyriales sp. CBS 134916]
MDWNSQLLSSLWVHDRWITGAEQRHASTHYGAYAHTTTGGIHIISITAEFWYAGYSFNFWNMCNPDTSGILAWLAQELSACEFCGQTAWIIGHFLSGYDGSNAIDNPSALFYSIVVRFSPSTVAGIFFGYTHQDQLQIFYDYLPNSTHRYNGRTYRKKTLIDYSKPLVIAYTSVPITPPTGLNAGYSIYQVDS